MVYHSKLQWIEKKKHTHGIPKTFFFLHCTANTNSGCFVCVSCYDYHERDGEREKVGERIIMMGWLRPQKLIILFQWWWLILYRLRHTRFAFIVVAFVAIVSSKFSFACSAAYWNYNLMVSTKSLTIVMAMEFLHGIQVIGWKKNEKKKMKKKKYLEVVNIHRKASAAMLWNLASSRAATSRSD